MRRFKGRACLLRQRIAKYGSSIDCSLHTPCDARETGLKEYVEDVAYGSGVVGVRPRGSSWRFMTKLAEDECAQEIPMSRL